MGYGLFGLFENDKFSTEHPVSQISHVPSIIFESITQETWYAFILTDLQNVVKQILPFRQ